MRPVLFVRPTPSHMIGMVVLLSDYRHGWQLLRLREVMDCQVDDVLYNDTYNVWALCRVLSHYLTIDIRAIYSGRERMKIHWHEDVQVDQCLQCYCIYPVDGNCNGGFFWYDNHH